MDWFMLLLAWAVLSLPIYVWLLYMIKSDWMLRYLKYDLNTKGDVCVLLFLTALAFPWFLCDPIYAACYRLFTGYWPYYWMKARLHALGTSLSPEFFYEVLYR